MAYLILIALLFSGCTKSLTASDLSAQEIPSQTPGYKCFAIMNGGTPISGNCVKE